MYFYYPLANEVAKGYSNATVRPSFRNILVNTLQWILTKLGTSAEKKGHFSKVGTVCLFLPSVFPYIQPLYNDPLSNATNDRVLWVKILHIATY
jgi:hypothetical protein